MVAISGKQSRAAAATKSKRIRVLLILVLLLIFVALFVGFVLQNLHQSIVQKQNEKQIIDISHESHLGLRNSNQNSIPNDHAHLRQQQQQQQQQDKKQQAEPDDDNDPEETDVVKEEEDANHEEKNNNALDDDDGNEDADEAEGEGDEAEGEGGEENATGEPQEEEEEDEQAGAGGGDDGNIQGDDNVDKMRQEEEEQGAADAICPYGSLSELTQAERYPRKNASILGADGSSSSTPQLRHIVDPPQGGKVALVCCMTTAGPWNFVIRHAWAPKVSLVYILCHCFNFNRISPLGSKNSHCGRLSPFSCPHQGCTTRANHGGNGLFWQSKSTPDALHPQFFMPIRLGRSRVQRV
jgi:hypothetical protein